MIGARRRQCRLSSAASPLLEEREVVGCQRLAALQGAEHDRDRHSPILVSIVIGEDERALDLILAKPVHLLEEAVAPVIASQLTIGDRREPNPLLHRNRVGDRGVFQFAQSTYWHFALQVRCARLNQLRRADEATNVIGAKRRLAGHHCLRGGCLIVSDHQATAAETVMTRKPPFRADHVGSLIRSPKLIEAHTAYLQGKMPISGLRELEDAAITDAIAMQERVGLAPITDGELRRNNWRDRFFEKVDGFSKDKIESSFIFTDYDGHQYRGMPIPVVVGTLKRRESLTADDFAFLKQRTRGTAKATLPAPSANHFFSGDKSLAGS